MLLFLKEMQNVLYKTNWYSLHFMYKQNGDFLKQKTSDWLSNNTLAFYEICNYFVVQYSNKYYFHLLCILEAEIWSYFN